ncbi:histidine--tRNA ligase [Candidatus Uhrbacteria bacterium]|nr:histidine--tRNA ligase [Candidatus Uhrbacteria bacterium]
MAKPTQMPGQGVEPKKKGPKTPELVRGFRDVLPEEQWHWDRIEEVARTLTKSYGFGRIRLPILEFATLFERTAGKESDVVQKEMYTFEDPGGDRVAMRPEGTAQVARAYIEHGMVNLPQPIKLWYFEQFFRHDRPQFGRYRQLQQFGLEAIGSIDPIIDAQIMLMTHRFYRELGVEVVLHVNSLGTPTSRREYIAQLVSYFKAHKNKLSETDKRRLLKNPLRLLDSKEPGMEELKAGAPQIVDYLDAESKQHFMKALEYLDEADVPYVLDPHLVRGLDYYTHTIFEVFMQNPKTEEMKGLALGGGGRYDGLVPMLGGRENTGAMGAGLGVDRTILAMKQSGVTQPHEEKRVDIFFCQLGDAARRKGLAVFEKIREGGMSCAEAFGKGSLKAQLEIADKLKAKLALILGQKEVLDGTIIIRDMDSGAQEIVDVEKVVGILARRVVAKNTLSLVEQTAIAAEAAEAEEKTADKGHRAGRVTTVKVEPVEAKEEKPKDDEKPKKRSIFGRKK